MKLKALSILVVMFLVLCGCSQNNDISSSTLATSQPAETTTSFVSRYDQVAKAIYSTVHFKHWLTEACGDVKAELGDGCMDIDVTVDYLESYQFMAVTTETIQCIHDISEEYWLDSVKLTVHTPHGLNDYMRWESTDLKKGIMIDTKNGISKTMTIDEMVQQYGYEGLLSLTDEAPASDNSIDQTSDTTISTEEAATGAPAYGRPGTEYYVYGIIDFGTEVDIIGYEDDNWINLTYERKNAYIEAKYFKQTSGTHGVIVNPLSQ